jgi:hypothetical protein
MTGKRGTELLAGDTREQYRQNVREARWTPWFSSSAFWMQTEWCSKSITSRSTP